MSSAAGDLRSGACLNDGVRMAERRGLLLQLALQLLAALHAPARQHHCTSTIWPISSHQTRACPSVHARMHSVASCACMAERHGCACSLAFSFSVRHAVRLHQHFGKELQSMFESLAQPSPMPKNVITEKLSQSLDQASTAETPWRNTATCAAPHVGCRLHTTPCKCICASHAFDYCC